MLSFTSQGAYSAAGLVICTISPSQAKLLIGAQLGLERSEDHWSYVMRSHAWVIEHVQIAPSISDIDLLQQTLDKLLALLHQVELFPQPHDLLFWALHKDVCH